MSVFSGIIGHKTAQEIITRLVQNDQLPHSMLFVGPKNTGKTTVITQLIRNVLNTQNRLESLPDVSIVKRLPTVSDKDKLKQNISVEQIREFNKKMAMSPLASSYKVGFIKEADKLSVSASNALLKTLEEPNGKALLILRATSISDLPATIVSRCQVINLYTVSSDLISSSLIKSGIGKKQADLFSDLAFGRPGLAISYIKDGSFRANLDIVVSSVSHLFQSSVARKFKSVTEIITKQETDKNKKLHEVLDRWESVLRDVLLNKIGCNDLCVYKNNKDDINKLTNKFKIIDLYNLLQEIRRARIVAKSNVNTHLILENILLT